MAATTKVRRRLTAGRPVRHRQQHAEHSRLDSHIEAMRLAKRTKNFDVLGEIRLMRVARPEGIKQIDLQDRNTLWVGFAKGTKQLVAISEWRGLPETEPGNEFCQECLADCTVCGKTGKKVCELCGGEGKLPAPMIVCPAPGCLAEKLTGPKPDCGQCNGSGQFVGTRDCAMCLGTKQMTCSNCRGTCKRPTGLEGGEKQWDKPGVQKCSACHGKCYAPKLIPHDLAPYLNGKHGGYLAIGPIVQFSIQPPGERNQLRYWRKVEPDGEEHMVLLVHPSNGEAFFVGGIVVEQ